MTFGTFIDRIYKVRNFIEKANQVEEAIGGFYWTDSFIGSLFDIVFDSFLPENLPEDKADEAVEKLGDLLYTPDPVTLTDIRYFYDHYYTINDQEVKR